MVENSKSIWLQTNEIKQFVGALEFAAEIFPSTSNDLARWKWVLIALHNALQGVFVCALSGADTAGISFLDKRSGEKMWEWLNATAEPGKGTLGTQERLAEMLLLYERVKSTAYLSQPLRSDTSTDFCVRKLNDLRNEFIHFVPQTWSVDLRGVPQIAKNACSVIAHLALSSPTFGHHYEEGDIKRITSSLGVLGWDQSL